MSDWMIVAMSAGVSVLVVWGVAGLVAYRRSPPLVSTENLLPDAPPRRMNRTAEVWWFDGEPTMEYTVKVPEDHRVLN